MAEHRQPPRVEPGVARGSAQPARGHPVIGLDRTSLKGMPMSTLTSTTSTRVGSPRLQDLPRSSGRAALRGARGSLPHAPDKPPAAVTGDEPWVTKRQLAAHLQVTPRWIELQHPRGLPHLRRGGIVRYRISVVESWLLAGPAGGA
jgi:hypothetical protein